MLEAGDDFAQYPTLSTLVNELLTERSAVGREARRVLPYVLSMEQPFPIPGGLGPQAAAYRYLALLGVLRFADHAAMKFMAEEPERQLYVVSSAMLRSVLAQRVLSYLNRPFPKTPVPYLPNGNLDLVSILHTAVRFMSRSYLRTLVDEGISTR